MMTYKKLLNNAIALYMDAKYDAAYDLITEHMHLVTGNLAQMYNFRYSFLGKAGRPQEGFDVLKDGIMDKGFWYPPELLLEDDDLEEIRKIDGFKSLVDLCDSRQQEDDKNGEYTLKIVNPKNADNHKINPLMIALHGDQENFDISEFDWQAIVKNGGRLALMQSAEIEFSQGYVWEDYNSAATALSHFVDAFENDYSKLMIGGFSAGAQVALWSLLSMDIKPQQLILVAPWLPDLKDWTQTVDLSKLAGIDITIICGDQDEDCFDCSKELHERLTSAGVDSKFHIIKDLLHDFPEDFDERISALIK